MRKLLCSLACLLGTTGLVLAAEVTFVKYDSEKKELTVKDDKDAETTYRLTDKTKVFLNDKVAKVDVLTNATDGKTKFDITTDKDEVTEIRIKFRKGK